MSTRPQRVLQALTNLAARGQLPPKRRKTERELNAESLEQARAVLHEADGRGFRVPNRGRGPRGPK